MSRRGTGRWWPAVLAVLLTAGTAGCTSGSGQAIERATAMVRGRAAHARDNLRDLLASPNAPPGGEALIGYVLYHQPSTPEFAVFFRAWQGDRLVLRQAITAKGRDDGGFGGVTEDFVRLCVELSGVRAADPAVELRDTTCDDEAIRRTEPYARPDVRVTVRLSD